jgi:hypothetical protein
MQQNIVPENTPEKDALKIDLGRDALPLIKEEYLRVGNFPAYRALRQLKKDSPLPSGEGIATTRTDVEYTYLSGRTLYHFFLEVDGENPQTIIDVFDQAAKTFSTKVVPVSSALSILKSDCGTTSNPQPARSCWNSRNFPALPLASTIF